MVLEIRNKDEEMISGKHRAGSRPLFSIQAKKAAET
jgi:hypothetical protein